MTATYSGNPATDDKDAVRHLIRDTDMDNPLLQDEEILWELSQTSNLYYAAAECARAVSIKHIGSGNRKRVGDLEISYGSISKEFSTVAADLRQQGDIGATPFAGGLTISDRLRVDLDNNRVTHWAKIGQHDHRDNAQAGTSDYSADAYWWEGLV